MLKNAIIAAGIASLSVSSIASAQDVRPAAVNLQPAVAALGALPAPAKAVVRKRNNLAPLLVVVVVVVTVGSIAGLVSAISSGSPG